MAEAKAKIYEAITKVMEDVGAVGKNKTNQIQKYKFRGIDDVMNALHPAMVKHHVFVAPEVLEERREERQGSKGGLLIYSVVKVKYSFYTDDGSSIEAVVIGEAMDSGDKSMNKAMSAAFKYACFQTFCIPTEEMRDSEENSPEIGEKTDKQKDKELAESVNPDLVPSGKGMDEERIKKVRAELKRTGNKEETILGFYKVKDIKDLTENQYISVMNQLGKKETKE